MPDDALDLAPDAARFRAHAAQALDLLRDPCHACSSVGFAMLGTDWRITLYRVRREAAGPDAGALAGQSHAFVWIARDDATEEELDGGFDTGFAAPEAAWHAAVEALLARLARQFRLPGA